MDSIDEERLYAGIIVNQYNDDLILCKVDRGLGVFTKLCIGLTNRDSEFGVVFNQNHRCKLIYLTVSTNYSYMHKKDLEIIEISFFDDLLKRILQEEVLSE